MLRRDALVCATVHTFGEGTLGTHLWRDIWTIVIANPFPNFVQSIISADVMFNTLGLVSVSTAIPILCSLQLQILRLFFEIPTTFDTRLQSFAV